MVILFRLLFLFGAVFAALPATAASSARAEHVSVMLVPQSTVPRPGTDDPIAIDISPAPGWHVYWLNPGDSGYAPALTWHLPTGVTAGAVQFPVPTMMTLSGIASNIHVGRTILLSHLRVPSNAPIGAPLRVALDLDLLTCSASMCVPQSLSLETTLTPGDGHVDPIAQSSFAAARAALPRAAAGPATYAVDGKALTVSIPTTRLADAQPVRLFFNQPGIADPGATQQLRSGESAFVAKVALTTANPPMRVSGVLSLFDRGKLTGIRFDAIRAAATPSASVGASSIVVALAAAILGGLLLNLMPCVFPILSLKAMALARSGSDAGEARVEALGYAVGAILTIVALGAIVLGLRAAGSSVGWAFQLQDSRVIAVLLLLVVAIATNLAGLYELPTPNLGGRQTSGFLGGVGTGALAAFIATPCTGPFMAGALGAALIMPTAAALAIFAGLGFGLALPFLLIGFFEPVRRWLPRPGNWMVTLRRLLSLPMFATAVGLAWILGRQAGVTAMTLALAAATLLGLALWWRGLRQHRGVGGWAPLLGVLAAVGLAVVLPAGAAPGRAAPATLLNAHAYSAARLARLRASGQPVFIYLTADWCLTCKVNEATTLSSERVAKAFARNHVAVLEGDWSRADPAITALLQRYHRAGVPLYLYFAPGKDAMSLPQVLTPSIVLNAIA